MTYFLQWNTAVLKARAESDLFFLLILLLMLLQCNWSVFNSDVLLCITGAIKEVEVEPLKG